MQLCIKPNERFNWYHLLVPHINRRGDYITVPKCRLYCLSYHSLILHVYVHRKHNCYTSPISLFTFVVPLKHYNLTHVWAQLAFSISFNQLGHFLLCPSLSLQQYHWCIISSFFSYKIKFSLFKIIKYTIKRLQLINWTLFESEFYHETKP